MRSPEDPFLQTLVARLIQPGVVGITLTGSHARGTQTPHSDLDIDIFTETLPDEDYTLQILNGKLVSLKYILLSEEYASLTKPEKAIWAVPGLRQMKILFDTTGQTEKLQQAALNFKWEPLQKSANEYAVANLMGCAEEAHKIISGLAQKNESRVLYASWGIFKGLSFAAAVQAGLMIESENNFFALLQDHFGKDHLWARAFRLSFGMDVENAAIPAYQTRGRAALDLYLQTALLFKAIINDKHRKVIEHTLQLISFHQQASYE